MQFAAYGLIFDSEIEVPSLACGAGEPAVTVRLGIVEPPVRDAVTGRATEFNPGNFRIHWGQVGTYLIRNGCEIVVDPEPGVEEAVVQLFLLGPALAYLLHQRGVLVLHASVVSVHDFVIGFLGEKGWGKSTTAAAINARGHALVADDLLAIMPDEHGVPMVLPGPPQFKLWPEAAAAAFGDDPEELLRLHSGVDKRTRPANSRFLNDSVPLRHLYILGRGTQLESIRMAPAEALLALVRHSYLSAIMKALGGVEDNFRQCIQVTRRVSVSSLKRPKDLNALGDIVNLVENEVARFQYVAECGELAVIR